MTAQLAVEVTGLSAWYGQAIALRDVDLSVRQDEMVAILGKNGAGKSTLLRSIARVHRSVRGSIRIFDSEVSDRSISDVAVLGVGFVREGAPVFTRHTVEENLLMAQGLARRRNTEPLPLASAWGWFAMLEERRHLKAGLLSGGQRQLLALSCALVSRPSVLLLDEPSAGLAPAMAEIVFTAIRDFCTGGLSVIVAEQNLQWLQDAGTRTHLLETGVLSETAGR